MTLSQILDIASKIGFGGLLVAIIYGSYKGVWGWGSQILEAKAEAKRWEALATRSVEAVEALNQEFATSRDLIAQLAKDGERASWLRDQGRQP